MSEQLVPGLRRSQSRKILQSSSMRVAAAVEEFNYERPLVAKKKKKKKKKQKEEADSSIISTTCSSSNHDDDFVLVSDNNIGGGKNYTTTTTTTKRGSSLGAMLRSVVKSVLPASSCRWLALVPAAAGGSRPERHLGRRVTGTLFGQRKGHVSFAVQDDPKSEPVLLLELATPTSSLVKEMASGLVRIALECDRGGVKQQHQQLFQEPVWTMYCNGRKSGYAVSRACGDGDRHLLRTVETVSIGAGVIPAPATEKFAAAAAGGGGELMYMRARFERVVGSRDSEAFYMMNPDGNGGPELSIFLLRI